ncbi:MAG: glucose-1-phosphate adenylyltransferase [Bacteroidota bacterium]|jgi:glucose-1-phosphate adenylyltransferase
MDDVLSIILGGGRGARLYPLTKYRAKPALPLAGKYRLIDIPVSNCINSGIQKMFVLTQFNSASLNQHVSNTYRFSPFSKGFVEVLAAQQTEVSPEWFQGTADAVRKALWVIEPWKVSEYLILSGDHLYRMDYRSFIENHRSTRADISVSVIPMDEEAASSFGLVKTDSSGRIVDFREKPTGEALDAMRVNPRELSPNAPAPTEAPFVASMGIYVFSREVLVELLKCCPDHTDFGNHVIPFALKDYRVQAYLFQGYWEDIGTVESFYNANLRLVEQPNPSFSFYDARFPIYTRPRSLPPTKVLRSTVRESMICDGCIIKASRIRNSIIGVRSRIEEGSVIENSLLMGADYYQPMDQREGDVSSGIPPVGIGANCTIRNAIIDKNARIGNNVKIINADKVESAEREKDGYWICNGIVVVIKGATIPDNAVI